MKTIFGFLPLVLCCVTTSLASFVDNPNGALVDDFSDPKRMAHGFERLLIDDKQMGSQSRADFTVKAGIVNVDGELAPGRGLPAFISFPLPLSAQGTPQDVSSYEGVRLRVKLNRGVLTVQVASSDIKNFDYHTSAPIAAKRGEYHDIKLPFSEMKRIWSEQIPLNLKNVTSVNLVVAGVAKGAFSYEVDEVAFY